MIRCPLPEIVRMVGGTPLFELAPSESELRVHGVSIDSRTIKPGNLYIPIVRIDDGHKYAREAVAKGASAILWQEDHGPPPPNTPAIRVKDTLQALQDLAGAYRKRLRAAIVGVTGSNRKTTVKDMIHSILGTRYKTYKTFGNLNGEYGLPLSLLEVEEDVEAVVLEMGMSNKGEIRVLSEIARPDIGIVTMIGVSHLSSLGSREAIAQAKLEILDGLAADGLFIYNGDEPLIARELDGRILPPSLKRATFGEAAGNDYFPMEVADLDGGTAFRTNRHDEAIRLPLLGRHNVLNALAAIAVADSFGMRSEEIKEGFENLALSAMRMERIPSSRGYLIINDAWNASPVSMKAAIGTVQQMKGIGKIVLVLGDMLELGTEERRYHMEIAKEIDGSKVNAVFTFGGISRVIGETLLASGYDGIAKHCVSKDELAEECLSILGPGDVILVKGSRGLKLEEVCTLLV